MDQLTNETTWEEVFNIHPDTIEGFTLRDLSSEKGPPVEKAPTEKVSTEKALAENVPAEKAPIEKVPVSIPRQRSAYPNIHVKPKPHKLGQLNITR